MTLFPRRLMKVSVKLLEPIMVQAKVLPDLVIMVVGLVCSELVIILVMEKQQLRQQHKEALLDTLNQNQKQKQKEKQQQILQLKHSVRHQQ